jgi:hypothetical protein
MERLPHDGVAPTHVLHRLTCCATRSATPCPQHADQIILYVKWMTSTVSSPDRDDEEAPEVR